ncbi:MAG: hypothetical protein KDI07_17840 [Anaerolineae bacterium]|nr:hypothetical protein [Anaerolineae bacterium]MCB0250441.1 hypothetical protein [Anaerolineae bacterium]
MTAQGELFHVCALCGGETWHGRGRLRVTSCPDGRALLLLEDGTSHNPWLELLPGDIAWLLAVLNVCAQRAAAGIDGAGQRSGRLDAA